MFFFGNIAAREIKYYLLRYNLSDVVTKVKGMLKKTELYECINSNEQLETKERIMATLRKLQALKSRISELRAQCEELQRVRAEDQNNALLCDECGRAIETGQEVEAKNFGEKARHYHKECFRKLWMQ